MICSMLASAISTHGTVTVWARDGVPSAMAKVTGPLILTCIKSPLLLFRNMGF